MPHNNDYYVYVHRRLDNNVVFYVGSGRLNRVTQKQGRTKEWSIIASSVGYCTEKIRENLNKEEARKIEEQLIITPHPDWQLVNKVLPTKAKELDVSFLSDYFYYDETSPSALRYKNNVYKNKGALLKSAGDVAGNVQMRNGKPIRWRLHVTIQGIKTTLNVHRIVWVLNGRDISSDLVIDHIDGNPLNNLISNLREVSYRLNSRNKKLSVSSKTGISGISIKGNCYRAEMTNGDIRIGKSFSINKYGESKALYLAAKTRYEFIMNQKEELQFNHTNVGIDKLLKIITDFESGDKHAVSLGDIGIFGNN